MFRKFEIYSDVTLHEENARGDIGSPGSLHRLLRGLSIQRAQKRDEFITAELTNHLFQSGCKYELFSFYSEFRSLIM